MPEQIIFDLFRCRPLSNRFVSDSRRTVCLLTENTSSNESTETNRTRKYAKREYSNEEERAISHSLSYSVQKAESDV